MKGRDAVWKSEIQPISVRNNLHMCFRLAGGRLSREFYPLFISL
jgi:hypothetical protein